MSTLVQCKLLRDGGTRDTLDGVEYHFEPYTDGAHVCEIDNDEHADRYLSITEGYGLYRGNAQPVSLQAADVAEAGDERAALVAQYVALYGERPHPRAGIAKLRELIAAKQ